MSEIPCLPLKQLTDGPLFSAGPGTLSALTNMELRPGGYAEARGGFEELKPSGGTAADAISAGGYSDALQMNTSYGWVRNYDVTQAVGSRYSKNLNLHAGGWHPFSTGVADHAVYWGADSPFSRVTVFPVYNSGGLWTTGTFVYEYWNGAWTALTTSETIDWANSFAQQYASWTTPSDWIPVADGDAGTGSVYKYWVRCRSTAFTVFITGPYVQFSTGYWNGMRELYAVTTSPRTSATSGSLYRIGQTGTTTQPFAVGTSVFSGTGMPARMANYRGRLFFVNGKHQKRWDGNTYADIGLPAYAGAATAVAAAVGGMGNGVWRYYIAYGYGPPQVINPGSGIWDPMCLYGPGQATYISEVTTVAGVTEGTRITLSPTAPPAGVGAAYIYRTDDLTNVPAADRTYMPAFLILAAGVAIETSAWSPASVDDTTRAKVFPPTEAVNFDCQPPTNCKHILIYQNRLLLGDDETWWWSDPFIPDRFSQKATAYIRLARAQGGRNMGGVEFADQAVLFTEDQTWGLSNVDLDVPQLYPIALGIGCVAPDSIAVVDGLLIWLARDGFYAWDGGKGPPAKISHKMKETFGKMNFETHGGSKATGHNRRYDIRLSNPDYTTIGSAYRFNIDSGEWCTLTPTGFTSTMFPLATIYAPLGNADAGAVHPLWGKVDYGTGAGEYTLFIGEQTTQDNGTNYTCSATMHFPLPPGALLTPSRVKAYYQASDGWGTPSFTNAVASPIGSDLGTLNTGTADTGSDYSIIAGTFSAVPRGASDLQITFSVSSAAGGTVNRQRLFGALLEGALSKFRRGGV